MATIELGAENSNAPPPRTTSRWSTSGPPGAAPAASSPVYERASLDHPDVVFGTVDTAAQQPLAAAAQITSVPTLMAFRDGSLFFSQPGALTAAALEQVITAMRELDIEHARNDTEQQRTA